jgi:hypothetical protein
VLERREGFRYASLDKLALRVRRFLVDEGDLTADLLARWRRAHRGDRVARARRRSVRACAIGTFAKDRAVNF